jgi:hypothetical protein
MLRVLKCLPVVIGILSVVFGASIAGAAPAALSAESPAPTYFTAPGTVVGPNTAVFHFPSLGPGQTFSSSAALPDGKTASVQLMVIQVTADWGNVYTWKANCRTIVLPITYSWFHVYEGMSGNGTKVTTVARPNYYYTTAPGWGLQKITPTPPRRYITGGKGNLIIGATFGTGYGPLSLHNKYYWHLIVNGNGTVNSGTFASVNCNIVG